MKASRFHVTFGEHIGRDREDSFIAQIAGYGLLSPDAAIGTLTVTVSRSGKLLAFRDQLTAWERWGFLRWSEDRISN